MVAEKSEKYFCVIDIFVTQKVGKHIVFYSGRWVLGRLQGDLKILSLVEDSLDYSLGGDFAALNYSAFISFSGWCFFAE